MGSYQIEWKRSAVKELRKLPRSMLSKIVKAVDDLSLNPYPQGVRKLAGSEDTYRIRVGDYRVLYAIIENRFIVQVIRVGHRRDVYK